MTQPTVDELAQIIADHYDADLNLADECEPGPSDIALARKIRNRIDTGVYFDHLSEPRDIHGYVRFMRLLAWPTLALLIAVAIAIGIILTQARSAA